MDWNVTVDITISERNESETDIKTQAMSYLAYKIADVFNRIWFPIMVPVGFIGNTLSFLVMVQQHNRNMSFSLYIASLAVTDNITLLIAFAAYLRQVHNIRMPPNRYWNCAIANTTILSSMLASTLLIITMTFERCYSIVKPHKAASFNTTQKAKITIACVCTFSSLYNIPNLFFSNYQGTRCIVNKSSIPKVEIYAWLSFTINFALPFISLLVMNCVIIVKLHERSKSSIAVHENQDQAQNHKMKSSDKQVYIMLLLVTFTYLILVIPMTTYSTLYSSVISPRIKSPKMFAGIYLYYHVGHKLHSTNNGINFFLYVMSGHKFRNDLLNLFRFNRSIKGKDRPTSAENTSCTSM